MSRYAGLEIDQNTLRIAIFDGSPKKYELVDFIEEEIAAESEEERQEVIRDILSEVLAKKENRGMDFVSGLDSRKVILREISVPYTRDDAIAKTIRFEAESYLHAHAIEDVVVEYVKCGEFEESSRLILCAVLKSHMEAHLATLQSAGVDPSVVELDATALATCFANTPFYSGEQNVLLVEVEPHFSRLVFLEKEHLVKIRSVWSRAEGVARADRLLESRPPDPEEAVAEPEAPTVLDRRFEDIERSLLEIDRADDGGPLDEIPVAVITDEEYARLTQSAEEPVAAAKTTLAPASAPSRSLSARGDALARLILEIERTFAGYVLTNPIDLVVVTGACAAELNAAERLAEHFEVDVVPFDLGDSFPVTWKGNLADLSNRGAVACGLGLRALGRGMTALDLRKEEFRFERRFERLMPSLTLLGFLFCLISLLWSISVYNKSRLLNYEIEVLQNTQRQWFQTFFGERPKGTAGPYQAAMARFTQMKGGSRRGGKDKVKQYVPVMDVFGDLMGAIRKIKAPKVFPTYHSIDFKLERNKKSPLKMTVMVADAQEGIRIKAALEKTELFDSDFGYASKTVTDKGTQATLDFRFKDEVIEQ